MTSIKDSGIETPKVDVVYHYTDANGLLGILRSGEMWCTQIAYLNDAMEYKYAFEVLRKVLTGIAEDEHREPLVRGLTQEALKVIEAERLVKTSIRALFMFVASFSEDRDDLSQWRAYSG